VQAPNIVTIVEAEEEYSNKGELLDIKKTPAVTIVAA